MKKTNVSSEVLISQDYSVKSRPRSKHSSFSHGKYECFKRGLDFTEQASKKHQKHTHGSMKKTNVSSEVLIFFLFTEQAPKKQQKTHTHPWKHEKDECFERGLDFDGNQQRFGPILDSFLCPF